MNYISVKLLTQKRGQKHTLGDMKQLFGRGDAEANTRFTLECLLYASHLHISSHLGTPQNLLDEVLEPAFPVAPASAGGFFYH